MITFLRAKRKKTNTNKMSNKRKVNHFSLKYFAVVQVIMKQIEDFEFNN
jgi:hypothetical protein